jgi:hypothetical protein
VGIALAQLIAKTLRREPTEADLESAAYDREAQELARVAHFNANGHTFVPQSDAALEVALKLAEANGGKLRTCWIMPLALTVTTDFHPYPNAKNEQQREALTRVEVGYDRSWKIDRPYWEHMQRRFAADYPLAFAQITESVGRYLAKEAA